MARLPYDTDRVESRPFIYGPRDWRSTPDIKVSREIDEYLDEIACMIANEISEQAEGNVFRTFHYNMMSRKDFRNLDFEKLVSFVCDFIEFNMATRAIRRPDDRLNETIASAVTLHCSKQIKEFPELLEEGERAHSSKVINAILTNEERFFDIVEAIDKMHHDDPRDARTRTRDEDDRRGWGGSRDRDAREERDERTRDFRSQYSGGSERDGGRERHIRGGRDERDTRRGGWGREERVLSGREVMEKERHDPSRDVDMSTIAQNRFVPVNQPEQTSRHIRHEDTSTGERFSATEPEIPRRAMQRSSEFIRPEVREEQYETPRFVPAPAQTQYEMQPTCPPPPPPAPVAYVAPPAPPPVPEMVQPVQSGINLTVNQEIINDDEEDGDGIFRGPFGEHKLLRRVRKTDMNITQHSSVYPAGSELGDALFKEAQKIVTLEAAVNDPAVTPEQIKSAVVIFDDFKVHDTVQSLAVSVSEDAIADIIDASDENTDGVRKIHHMYGVVSNAIVGFKHLNDFQQPLNDMSTLRDIIALLKRAKTAVDTHASVSSAYATDLRSAVSRFDKVITKEINTFCREVIKISNGNAMTSAMVNFDELLNAVQDGCTPEQSNALLAFLSGFTASIREALAPELNVAKLVMDASVEETEQEHRGVALLPMAYLVTHVPFTSGELGLESDGTSVISNNSISRFLKTSLNVGEMEHPNFSKPNRMLVTRDMEVFRIYEYPGRAENMVLVPVPV